MKQLIQSAPIHMCHGWFVSRGWRERLDVLPIDLERDATDARVGNCLQILLEYSLRDRF